MDGRKRKEAKVRFEAIYYEHYPAVLNYASRRTFNRADADDATAETFLTAWRRLDVLPLSEDSLPWLYAVARRVIANQHRGNYRRSDLRAKLGFQVSTKQPAIDTGLIVAEEHQAVLYAISRLRPDDQEVLRLVAWEQLSHRHIALVLDCAESAVAVRLQRARARLQKEMQIDTAPTGHIPPRRAAHRNRDREI